MEILKALYMGILKQLVHYISMENLKALWIYGDFQSTAWGIAWGFFKHSMRILGFTDNSNYVTRPIQF